MANYTITLRDILQDENAKAKINKALSSYPLYEKKSLEEFIPCYIPTREELNTKLLNHFKYREIGFDTVGRFIDELEIAMNEIMPYYNLMFHSIDQDFDIKFNVDYTRTTDTDKTGNNTNKVESESNTSNSGTNVTETDTDNTVSSVTTDSDETSNTSSTSSTTTSESTTTDTVAGSTSDKGRKVGTKTPQNLLTLPEEMGTQGYADEVEWSKNNSTNNSTSNATNSGESTATASGSTSATSEGTTKVDGENKTTSKSNETTTETTTMGNVVDSTGSSTEKELVTERTAGNFGVVSSQDLIMKYRQSIINVEQMIMYDTRIQELFMMIY